MDRWKQYGGLAGLLGVSLAAALWGFAATGGSLPYGKRFATSIQRGLQEGSGPLVEFGRGVLVAGPIRNGGLVVEFLALTGLLAAVGVSLYLYVDRYGGLEEKRGARDQ
jgi:hypothetical protein